MNFVKILIGTTLAFLMISCQQKKTELPTIEKKPLENYEPNWASLAQHTAAPEWFQDAKLGIYFHWGIYSVPAYDNEWYPYKMYRKDSKVFDYHKEKYGDQSEFGYHHFIPDFKAEYFDAEEWVELFEKAGAKFAGPVAQHHDGFAMWDSEVNPWNVKDKGPKKDITGALTKALRAKNMKLITTFHHARNLQRYKEKEKIGFASHYTYQEDWHTSTEDPELKLLYGNVDEKWFEQYWYDQIDEVVKNYNPDIIWFDSWLNFMSEQIRQKMVANYLNHGKSTNQEVVVCYKQTDLPASVGIHDIEQGGKRDVSEFPWMTDITISYGSWCYVEGQQYKPTSMVLRNFIDVVSKNGVVLLNISPKADGTIPAEQRKILEEMGAWLDVNGEAIFNTRPWVMFGFGNAKAEAGRHGGQSATVKYTASDIRFTRSKDSKVLYMIFLGKPASGWTNSFRLMSSQGYFPEGEIKEVSLLSNARPIAYELGGRGFKLELPSQDQLDEMANVVKIELY